MSWEYYINSRGYNPSYDDILDYIVLHFPSMIKDRSDKHCDMKHYVVNWWFKNKRRFYKYTGTQLLARKLNLTNHTSVIHYIHKRVPSHNYQKNIKELKEIIGYEAKKLRKSA